jgi:Flp pilus assembly protein TadG
MTFVLDAIRDNLRALRAATGGSIAPAFALALVPLVGAAGAALDYSKANQVKATLQAALDSAVLAGVKPSTGQVSTATSFFNASFSDNLGTNATSSFTVNQDGSISGTAQATVPTSFMAIVNVKTLTVSASAKAAITQTASTACILVLDATATQALLVNSGANIKAPNCEIHVRSTASPAAIFNASSTLNVKNICVKGANVTKNGGTNPPVKTSCAAISDPFAGVLPVASTGSCTYNNQVYNGSTVTLSPGVYCGNTNFNGSPTITFNPGLYVIKGGPMTINSGAKIAGNGVTFYFADQNSKIQFNGGISGTLLAPTSGTYANILMYEAPGLAQSQFVFDGTNGESLQGLIYLPSRAVTFNSVSSVASEKITLVVDTLILDSTNWSFDTSAMTMPGTTSSGGGPYLVN